MTAPIDPRAIASDLGIPADGVPDEELTRQLLAALVERNALFRKLARIQRSISHRAPLHEVLDAITAGAAELLGDEVVGLRLLDPTDPNYMVLRSVSGLSPDVSKALERGPVGEGAGGRAIQENRLIIVEDYQTDPQRLPALAEAGLQAAMAAPVYEYGELAGSLVVASYVRGRKYTATEQEILLAFAEHASLALTDARTVERLREAQHAKDMFFAMASHELKTPLTVIMGTLRTIEKHHTVLAGAVREEMLSAAYERGRDLKELIDRLLQGARAELAGLIRDVHLPELIDRSIRGFDQSRLRVRSVPDEHVEIDDLAVYEILGVFLENAIKHSPDGSKIDVVVSIDGGIAKVCVVNDGTLPDDLAPEELFEAFRRGEDSETSGVGLGLYIAARLADAIKGRVDVRSEDGKVSFGLHFPTHAVSAAEVPIRH
ncbi:MAG TPA: GAF domain-containing sensor histidine kinase [Actinomycetota bacterium]|nr:GAF domain-containing sensor histidine kinase [Actinomycetota bacterium]